MNLESKTIRLRLVVESDAAFIFNLRINDTYNAFLSKIPSDLTAQINWINKYKEDEKNGTQYYFIIETLSEVPCGTVRIYDIQADSFCWGSWILNESKTRYAAIESAFLVYRFGFEHLGFLKSHFDVMKGNEKVISFHKNMGAIQVKEDDNNVYFNIDKETIDIMLIKLREKLF